MVSGFIPLEGMEPLPVALEKLRLVADAGEPLFVFVFQFFEFSRVSSVWRERLWGFENVLLFFHVHIFRMKRLRSGEEC
jgi:hypothetical protein